MLNNKSALRAVHIAIMLNSCILLFPSKFKIYPIIIFLIFSLICTIKIIHKKPFSYKKIILISALFLIYIASHLVSLKDEIAFNKIATMSSLLAYPLIFAILDFCNFKFDNKVIKIVFIPFIASTIVFCVGSFLFFWNQKYTFLQTFVHYSNLVDIGLGNYNIHPIYLSLYVGISILMIVYLLITTQSIYLKTVLITTGVFLTLILMILMRKGPIIFLIISLFFYLQRLFKIRFALIAVCTVFLVMLLSLKFIPKYKDFNRFNDFRNILVEKSANSSTYIRYRIYECTIEQIYKSPLLGYGINNVQQQLNQCYKSKNFDATFAGYNAHNQYISIILTSGLVGFIIFLFTIFKIFAILSVNRNKVGLAIFIFFLLNFLTENIAEREDGILIYAFLISFFIFYKSELKTLE